MVPVSDSWVWFSCQLASCIGTQLRVQEKARPTDGSCRDIGTLWLVGFPVGTALGLYTWKQTGDKWASVDDAPPT